MALPLFVVLAAGSALSFLACAVVIFTYIKFKPLRRHPGGIVFLKTYARSHSASTRMDERGAAHCAGPPRCPPAPGFCATPSSCPSLPLTPGPGALCRSLFDLVFSGQTAVVAILLLSDGDDLRTDSNDIQAQWNSRCRWPAFISQFSALGAFMAASWHTRMTTAGHTRARCGPRRLRVLLSSPGSGPVAYAHQPVHRLQAQPALVHRDHPRALAVPEPAARAARTRQPLTPGPRPVLRSSPSSPA